MVCAGYTQSTFRQHRIFLKTYREPWPHPYLSELPLFHGESFLTLTTTETIAGSLETSHQHSHHLSNMIKVEMVDLEEAQSLLNCANPHDIYPEAAAASQLMHLNILVSSSQLQDQDSFDATVYSAKSECPTPVGYSYDSNSNDDICESASPLQPQRALSSALNNTTSPQYRSQSGNSCSNSIGPSSDIRMEEFQELDVSGLPVPSDPGLESTNAEHDLNTPVFEKNNPFDVDLTATELSLSQSSNIPNQHSNNNYMFNYVIKEEPIISSDRSWLLDNVTEPSYTINVTTNNSSSNIFSECGGSSFFWPSTSKASGKTCEDVIISDNSAVNKIDVLDEFIILARDSYSDEEYNSVYKRECLSSASSEDSVDVGNSVPPRLILPEIPNIFASDNNAVNTPDVIKTIEEFEADHKRHDSDGFNILQFISDQDLATSSNIIESLELPPITTTTQNFLLDESNTTDSFGRSRIGSKSSSYTSKSSRRNRKRSTYDDDEDYIPPTKVRSTRVTQKPKILIEYESDLEHLGSSDDNDSSDSDESTHYGKYKSKAKSVSQKRRSTFTSTNNTNAARRGRPVGSKASTSVVEPENKYREMRDKNNEASRKSRLKKKQQESHYFVEVEDLEQHNVQLKARVFELQKTVDNFRTNLMKVMLNK